MKMTKTDRFFDSKHAEESVENRLARRLAQLRIDADFTQRGICNRLRIGVQLYSSWECGSRIELLQLRYLVRIAKFYGLTVADLFGDVAPKVLPTPRLAERAHGRSLPKSKFIVSVKGRRTHQGCFPGSASICAECREFVTDPMEATA
jgi:transcriptional regulator with XRE-family HTH domain